MLSIETDDISRDQDISKRYASAVYSFLNYHSQDRNYTCLQPNGAESETKPRR